MLKTKNLRKGIMVAVAVFVGFGTVAFAAYYVYEHKEELPIIKNFFEEESLPDNDYDITEEATVTPTWVIEVEDGNIIKTYQNGDTTVLIDKDDYDDIDSFSDVATSPDNSHMCFLAHTLIPVWMYHANTDGTDVTRGDVAENCVWSNDSSMIAYTNHTTDVSPHDVHVYFLSTQESTNYTNDLSTDTTTRIYGLPVWSDDDRTITSDYKSYDSGDGWTETSGTSIINILTGEVQDVEPEGLDTSDWSSYEYSDANLSLKHPSEWTVSKICDGGPGELCSLKATDGEFIWMLDFDPFVTGGGFGFLFDALAQPLSTAETPLSIDGFDVVLVTNYYDGSAVGAEIDNGTVPKGRQVWGWSVTFTDPDDFGSLGFGPGEMYDQTENNWWSIMYKYTLPLPKQGVTDYSDLPQKGDDDLSDAFAVMNAISESLSLPE